MSYKEAWAGEFKTIARMSKKAQAIENRSEATVQQYIIGIKQFLEFHGESNPDEFLEAVREGKVDINRLIEDFVIEKDSQGLNTRTIRNYVGAIEKWLYLNDVEVQIKESVKPKGVNNRPLDDRIPKTDELKKLMIHTTGIRDKTIIEMAASSGLRKGTLLSLRVDDVNFDIDPDIAMITVKGGPGKKLAIGRKYFTFITPEARHYLELYREKREKVNDWNPESPLFTLHFDTETDKRIGRPLSSNGFSKLWQRLLDKASLDKMDEAGKRSWYILHFHTLRKFFMTQCSVAAIKPQFYNFWLGRKRFTTGSNDHAYFKAELENHIEEYKKAIPLLSIEEAETEEVKKDVSGLYLKVQEQARQIRELQSYLSQAGDLMKEAPELFAKRLQSIRRLSLMAIHDDDIHALMRDVTPLTEREQEDLKKQKPDLIQALKDMKKKRT